MSPDKINGLFELAGTWFVLGSIFRILRDGSSRGVWWPTISFFAAWGYWNLYYYPHLEQWFSFSASALLAFTNTVYTALLIWFRNR